MKTLITKTNKKIRITNDLVGRFVRIRFDDIGQVDALVASVDIENKFRSLRAFFPSDCSYSGTITEDQIVAIGPRLTVPKF